MAKKHWIYIKRGLSEDPKHRAQMGECVWLYMHIIDRADWETGIAYDWKDSQEAAEMGMPVDTLCRQRQKLDEMRYVHCEQKQHGQDIYIYEWRNPREYDTEVKNPRSQGSHEQPPSTVQGDNQGSNQGSNQVTLQVETPTSSSESISMSVKHTAPDFSTMEPIEAMKVPELRLFRDATGFFPGRLLYEMVYVAIHDKRISGEQLKTAYSAWLARGYNAKSLDWLEWCDRGVPARSFGRSSAPAGPASIIPDAETTRQMLAEKEIKAVPPPPEFGRAIKRLSEKLAVKD
jgi:hypothetical protein